jgi:hypothetical protein
MAAKKLYEQIFSVQLYTKLNLDVLSMKIETPPNRNKNKIIPKRFSVTVFVILFFGSIM